MLSRVNYFDLNNFVAGEQNYGAPVSSGFGFGVFNAGSNGGNFSGINPLFNFFLGGQSYNTGFLGGTNYVSPGNYSFGANYVPSRNYGFSTGFGGGNYVSSGNYNTGISMSARNYATSSSWNFGMLTGPSCIERTSFLPMTFTPSASSCVKSNTAVSSTVKASNNTSQTNTNASQANTNASSLKNIQWWKNQGYNSEKGKALMNYMRTHATGFSGNCVGVVREAINKVYYGGTEHYARFGKACNVGRDFLSGDVHFKKITGVDLANIDPKDIPEGAIILYPPGYSNGKGQTCGHGEISDGNGRGYSDGITHIKNANHQKIQEIWIPV